MDSTINSIVERWDLRPNEVEEKKKILDMWKENINPNYYDLLLEICGSFTYYSSTLVESTFKNIIENDLDTLLSEDNFLVFQLTTKDTIESSHSMYSNFISATNLSYSHADYCFSQLSILIDKLITLGERINVYGKNIQYTTNEKKLLHILRNVDTLIFVDDFIGTGTNVIHFLKKNLADFKMLQNFLDMKEYSPLNVIIVVLEVTEVGLENIIQVSNQYSNTINLQIVNGELAESIFKSHNIFDENQEDLDKVENNFKEIAEEKGLHWKKYQTGTRSGFNLNLNIASYVNTPNNTFPLISQPESRTKKWEALFPRKRRKRNNYDRSDKEFSTFLMNLTDRLL